MIKIEFPADRADIALALSAALQQIATGTAGAHVALAERDHKHLGAAPGTATVHPDATVVQTAAGHVNTQTGEVVELELPATPGDTARLDHKGVAFDAKYCANAQDPFYASGKESGQWKAKRGLAAGVYENWYAQQLAAVQPTVADEDTDTTPTVATGAAFGAVVTQQAAPAPADLGQFMTWVSEQMVAGRLQQATIDGVYTALGIRIQDLVPPTPANVVTNNLSALYNHLAPIAGA